MLKYAIDREDVWQKLLKGKKVALITSSSGVNSNLRASVDVLNEKIDLRFLLAPEHGIRGEKGAGEEFAGYIDIASGLQVHSLYNKSKHINVELLNDIDAIVYDIADVGARYYTYLSTLLYTMRACAEADKELIVFDRPDPLGGMKVEGPILQSGYESFIGAYPLCVRYGLTIGEFAKMANEEQNINCNLTVVLCEGWHRGEIFAKWGKLWVNPSPNIATFEAALAYPGTCLFEGTNLSEGRGTTSPFTTIGAPYINATALASAMQAKQLQGAAFAAACFVPTASKHKGQICSGVRLYVTNEEIFEPVRTGIELLECVQQMYPMDFEFLAPIKEGSRSFIELLIGSDYLSKHGVKTKIDTASLLETFTIESKAFKSRKEKFHLYP